MPSFTNAEISGTSLPITGTPATKASEMTSGAFPYQIEGTIKI
jgi:hypothetical protein